MKRITFEVEDEFSDELSQYCLENKTSKKSLITKLLNKEIQNEDRMGQYNFRNMDKKFLPFMNKKNYKRLFELPIKNEESWNLRSNIFVNSIINDCFKKDEVLNDIRIMAHEKNIKEFKIPGELLDHYYYVEFTDENLEYHFNSEIVYGIMTFPYMSFNNLKRVIETWNTEFWNIYIINPILMQYTEGTIGLFITPKDNYFLLDANGFIESKTGYKLFYNWTDEDIRPIEENNSEMPDSFWIERLTNDYAPIMSEKIIKFWLDNKEDIECEALERNYFAYKNKMPFVATNVLMDNLKGPIEMINTKTGWSTGKCNLLGFDVKAFNCIYVDHKVVEFTDEQLEDFKNGDFELKLHK